ncbi:Uncharacterised protein [Legionella quateirensis]|uniref:Uncharacterized protein n=1 Tax=Legionella quateirensis TaxID=45072 RepID=A0A378KUC2_9GAMM|nr:Uncharacterised protein [Legionella quateirensis]
MASVMTLPELIEQLRSLIYKYNADVPRVEPS